MMIQLNFKSGKPVYLQVVDQIKAAAASGALRSGEPLPSIRPLAEQLRINRNTVAKAYAELERWRTRFLSPGAGRASLGVFRAEWRCQNHIDQMPADPPPAARRLTPCLRPRPEAA